MKVVHISYSDKQGGAAIAAYRHHEAMKQMGIESKMLVLDKRSEDEGIIQLKKPSVKFWLGKAINKFLMLEARFYAVWSWNHYGGDISSEPSVKNADIVILHWINGFTASIRSIEKILESSKQVYWFMHDMWPITGGCHHSFECDKFQTHCGACPMYNNKQGHHRVKDLSYWQYEEKLRRLSPYSNLSFLTPSRWLANQVKRSGLFKDHNVDVVPNVLDTNVFCRRDKSAARKRLGLPIDKKLILFGADNIHSPYKGWDYLRDALKDPIADAECVIYGNVEEDIQSQIEVPLYSLGRISDVDKLVDLYSACDVFVTPSLADNYPNVLVEAMACGLPCVGFATGGIPEIIQDGVNGILVSCYDSLKLRNAIIKILNSAYSIDYSKNAIRFIQKNNVYSNIKKTLSICI